MDAGVHLVGQMDERRRKKPFHVIEVTYTGLTR